MPVTVDDSAGKCQDSSLDLAKLFKDTRTLLPPEYSLRILIESGSHRICILCLEENQIVRRIHRGILPDRIVDTVLPGYLLEAFKIRLGNIDISKTDLKGFEKVARKYGIDYAIRKDSSVDPPHYLFF